MKGLKRAKELHDEELKYPRRSCCEERDKRDGQFHNLNPPRSASSFRTMKLCSPVIHALPVSSGTIAGNSPTVVRPATWAENVVPIMLSCTNGLSACTIPIASSTASTAHVPVPHGDLSTSASAKIVTLRR